MRNFYLFSFNEGNHGILFLEVYGMTNSSLQRRECHPCQSSLINLLLAVGVDILVAPQKDMMISLF